MRCNILCFGLTAAVVCMVAGSGCAPSPAPSPKAKEEKAEPVAHKHDHNAPGKHGGQQQLLGNHEYHAELTRNEATGEVAIYITDSQFNPVAVPEKEMFLTVAVAGQPTECTLTAQPNPPGGEPRFVFVDKQLSEAIEKAEGGVRLNAIIKGKPYAATYTAAAHSDHEHDGKRADEHDHH